MSDIDSVSVRTQMCLITRNKIQKPGHQQPVHPGTTWFSPCGGDRSHVHFLGPCVRWISLLLALLWSKLFPSVDCISVSPSEPHQIFLKEVRKFHKMAGTTWPLCSPPVRESVPTTECTQRWWRQGALKSVYYSSVLLYSIILPSSKQSPEVFYTEMYSFE